MPSNEVKNNMKDPIQIIDDQNLPLFTLTEDNKGTAKYEHSHSKDQITYIESGLMKIIINTDIYLIPSGYLIYIPRNLAHNAEVQRQTVSHHLYIDNIYTKDLVSNAKMFCVSGLLKELILKMIHTGVRVSSVDVAYLTVLRFELLSLQPDNTYSLPIPSHSKLQNVLRYINDNISQKIQLTLIADHVHLSTRQLSRIFKKETGMSFSLWIQNYKVLIAIKRLPVVKMTSVVASELGYDSDSAFIHMFKRLTNGKIPSDFYR